MAIWKDIVTKDPEPNEAPPVVPAINRPRPEVVPTAAPPGSAMAAAAARKDLKESVLAAGLTFEGKIEGSGHVRIAGRFKGDVNVQGNVTVEQGAHVTGQVNAATVIVSGELEDNINASARVELLKTGVINGDVKAAVMTVAAGSRMRGQADFGWGDQGPGRK